MLHGVLPSWLVVSTPLKNIKVNWDDDIPNIWKNKHVPNYQPAGLILHFWKVPHPRESSRLSAVAARKEIELVVLGASSLDIDSVFISTTRLQFEVSNLSTHGGFTAILSVSLVFQSDYPWTI